MYPSTTDVVTGITTFALPNGRRIQFTDDYVEDYPDSVCKHLIFAASKGKEMATRHPKYTAEAARLSAAKTKAVSEYKVGWADPRSDAYPYLSSTSTDADRKAMDEKIRKEYDDLFWSTATGSKFTTATVASPSSWDYVDYDFAKKELPMNPFLDKIVKMEYVGSRVTCSPPPTDTDEDVLLLTDDLSMLIADCIEVGFTRDGYHKASYPTGFVSLRNGTMNFIVTDNEEFFKKFMLATHVCKSLNVTVKANRICVFQAILYGNEYQPF
jgi:hypothetical protein